MRIVTLAGMSAVFSALFGTPLTASVFALEVISVGVIYYSALVPCLVAALVALQISVLFGAAPTRFALMAVPVSAPMVIRIMGLALLCTALSIVLCLFLHGTEHFLEKRFKNEPSLIKERFCKKKATSFLGVINTGDNETSPCRLQES